jgi:hypothetical protein
LDKKKARLLYLNKKNKLKNKKLMAKGSSSSRSYMYSLLNLATSQKREWNSYKQRSKRKKRYVYVNKFKDCGNQYNFDPFHPYSTYKLNDYNFYRNKKQAGIVKQKKISLSSFDSRLHNVNFKFFNGYLYSLVADVYKKIKNKNNFLLYLKKNTVFCYNLLLFLKKRIVQLRFVILELSKVLNLLSDKISIIHNMLEQNESVSLLLIKKKYNAFFIDRLISLFDYKYKKYINSLNSLDLYKSIYFSLFDFLNKKNVILKKKQQKRMLLLNHFKEVTKNESFLTSLISTFGSTLFRLKNFKAFSKWEKKTMRNSLFINLYKYITLYKSLYKYKTFVDSTRNHAVLYIRSTVSNVYLYFIYNNKILIKKTCGELPDIKKKERRFWRNVYPLVESILPFIVEMKSKYRFPFVSLYMNGTSSLCTPLFSRMRKYNKRFRRLVYFLINELNFFQEKTSELKGRYKCNYKFFPIYRLKLFSIFDGFNKLSKIFFAINKVKDITSWPYNGCKKKKTKVRNAR